MRKKTDEEFREELKQKRPDVIQIDKYINAKTEISVKCKKCGNIFKASPNGLLGNVRRCKVCGLEKQLKSSRKTNEEFIKELSEINPNIEPIEEYINAKTKIKVKCKVCNHIWSVRPSSLVNSGKGCPKCAGTIRKTGNDIVKLIENSNRSIEILTIPENTHSKIKIKCKICNHIWEANVSNIIYLKQGCPKCANNIKKTTEEFQREISEINNDILLIDEYINTKTKIKVKCKKCGNIFSITPYSVIEKQFIRCNNCNPLGSNLEIDLADNINNILNNLDEKSEEPLLYRNRKFEDLRNPNYKLELDIYIPKYNLGIEFDGLYWHSEEILKNRKTQLQKREFFEKNYNIRVIFVREDEWVNNKDIVISRIKNILHIKEENDKILYARNLIIGEDIRTNIKDIFLDRYHIQGKDIATLKYGLYTKDGKLVSVMTFVKNRMIGKIDNEKRIIELSRFASRTNINIVGGFSKLLKYAEKQLKEMGYDLIKTYADRRWSSDNNNVYLKNGFTLTGITEPNYIYFKGTTIYSRQSFQKKKLKEKFPEVYEDELTEFEIANLAGYNRYYDCGNLVYYKEIAKP